MKKYFPQSTDYDLLGVGFGPAGIALACAISDLHAQQGFAPFGKTLFLERAADTQWHPELLLSGTDINHHPLRDLVTPRDPRSKYSFAMYLKERGRLYRFGQLGRPASRVEWSDYIKWVAEQLAPYVAYDEPVLEILPEVSADRLTHLQIVTKRGVQRTRRLVLSNGSLPRIPSQYESFIGPRVFHTVTYLSSINALNLGVGERWLVIGSGQSASEAITDILGRKTEGLVHSLHRSSGFKLTQLGHFPNLAFSPERVDYFHHLEPAARRRLLSEVKATNYSGIDPDESQALFSMVYEDELLGKERLKMHVFHETVSVTQTEAGYRVLLRDVFNGSESVIDVDGIVLATGYQQPLIPPLLAALQPWLVKDDDGGLLISRDYRIQLESHAEVDIFANGLSERAHGIGDGQSFSLMAMRAERILSSLLMPRNQEMETQ
jgi:L-ornithine N5-oxygenase